VTVLLDARNESSYRWLYRTDVLKRLTGRVCAGEGVRGDVELSLLFCTDTFIQRLNRQYRGKNRPTDVLAFAQPAIHPEGLTVLGDIVISMDTVATHCGGDRRAMRDEIPLLFCHGLLHLLGCQHAKEADRKQMAKKQARYLNRSLDEVWPKPAIRRAGRTGPV
jgi:probable rRNA maturation factor